MRNAMKENVELLLERNAAMIAGGSQWREYCMRFVQPGGQLPPDEVLEISLHKCRVHWRGCPAKLLKESVWWLLDHEMSLDLGSVGSKR